MIAPYRTIWIGFGMLVFGCSAPDADPASMRDADPPINAQQTTQTPTAPVLPGSFQLVTVGDSTLPLTMGMTDGCPLQLVREEYRFDPKGNWSWSRLLVIQCPGQAVDSQQFSSTSAGVYRVRGDTVFFYSDSEILMDRATLKGDELRTWSDDEYDPKQMVFERQSGE